MNQAFVDALSGGIDKITDDTLRGRCLTLGEYISKLEAVDLSLPIVFEYPENDPNGWLKSEYEPYDDEHNGLGGLDSYRGYYRFVAIKPSDKITNVDIALTNAQAAMGEVFTGYKGGEYTMGRNTFIWCAYYGDSSSLMITDVSVRNNALVVVSTDWEPDVEEGVLEEFGRKTAKKFGIPTK